MFIDKIDITVISGKGGDGKVSFRREKYVPNGGPDGGDGGSGGSIILKADATLNNLGAFRFKRKFAAENGQDGMANRCSGKNAPDLIINVPIGTAVFNKENGRLMCDLTENGQEFVAAKGGRGGQGNQHYATSTRQAPKFSKPGNEAEEKTLTLELKTIADVGLIGFPNVGKSTLLSRVTNARPKIADYHFTTLSPNLGIVRYKDADDFIIADIPGIIEGASEGLGLGFDFLRHIERTRLLVHVIDVSGSEGRDPKEDFDIINEEMFTYSEGLKERKQIVVLNKADLLEDMASADELKSYFDALGYDTFIISAASDAKFEELLDCIIMRLSEVDYTPLLFTEEELKEHNFIEQKDYEIEKEDGVWYVTGKMLERLVPSVNFEDYESLAYFQRVLKNKGVFAELEAMGIEEGDTVDIEGFEFEYYK